MVREDHVSDSGGQVTFFKTGGNKRRRTGQSVLVKKER